MAENAEQIEAKLAAYIDGELSAAERTEIEKHLAANPSHRALIQDVIRHRQILRQLPRERAPANMTEGLEGQLERQALLGGGLLMDGTGPMRINRWPQILSAAAILGLATGLGVVVYSVLPPQHPVVSIAGPTEGIGEPRSNVTQDESGSEVGDFARSEAGGGGRGGRGGGGGGGGFGGSVAKSGMAGHAMAAVPIASNPARALATASLQRFKAAEGERLRGMKTSTQTVLLTVTADDVNRANRRMLAYLSQNKIAWFAPDRAFQSAPGQAGGSAEKLALEPSQPANAAGQGATVIYASPSLKANPGAILPPGSVTGTWQLTISGGTSEPQPLDALVLPEDRQQPVAAITDAPLAGPTPTTQPAVGYDRSSQAKRAFVMDLGATSRPAVTAAAANTAQDLAKELGSAEPEQTGNVIVIRNLNGAQIGALARAIEQSDAGDRASVTTDLLPSELAKDEAASGPSAMQSKALEPLPIENMAQQAAVANGGLASNAEEKVQERQDALADRLPATTRPTESEQPAALAGGELQAKYASQPPAAMAVNQPAVNLAPQSGQQLAGQADITSNQVQDVRQAGTDAIGAYDCVIVLQSSGEMAQAGPATQPAGLVTEPNLARTPPSELAPPVNSK